MPDQSQLSQYEKALKLKYSAEQAKKKPLFEKAGAIEQVVDEAIGLLCAMAMDIEELNRKTRFIK